jgi:hypothetical protein
LSSVTARAEVELGAKRFEELLNRKKLPELLFHYTDQKGLLAILTTGELWATKVQYMNDSTEFGLAVALAENVLTERISATEDAKGKRLLQCIIDHLGGIANANICSVSFCGNPDLLSQWRGYSGADCGFALGFRTLPLTRIAWRDGARLGHCIYEKQEQTSVVSGMIDEALQNVAKLNDPIEVDILQVAALFERVLIKFGAFFKGYSFHEEEEWRLVTDVTGYLDEKFCFRPGKSMLTPYYRISLRQEAWKDEIAAVTVGPCPHPQIAKLAVEGILIKHCISDGGTSVVTPSNIPYRNW